MLLPSALSCDSSQPPLQSALFISPPTSPHPFSAQSAIGNLINSCRNLHNLISSSPVHNAAGAQLPSPPLANMASPLRPRLRKREAKGATASVGQADFPRYRIKKRVAPPRGVNKRRRAVEDDGGRDDEDEEDEIVEEDNNNNNNNNNSNFGFQNENANIFGADEEKRDSGVFVFRGVESNKRASSPLAAAPSTPKRQRIAPPDVPRGLSKEDFHKLGPSPMATAAAAAAAAAAPPQERIAPRGPGAGDRGGGAGDEWPVEDDHKLVEIVLEKVKNMDLSSDVWEDCVRNLPGRDYDSVSSRWRSLLRSERVGLQKRRSRGRLHGTW